MAAKNEEEDEHEFFGVVGIDLKWK